MYSSRRLVGRDFAAYYCLTSKKTMHCSRQKGTTVFWFMVVLKGRTSAYYIEWTNFCLLDVSTFSITSKNKSSKKNIQQLHPPKNTVFFSKKITTPWINHLPSLSGHRLLMPRISDSLALQRSRLDHWDQDLVSWMFGQNETLNDHR